MIKNWQIVNKKGNQDKILGSNNIISFLLENRGLTDPKEIDKFINPRLESISLEMLEIDIKEINKAVSRINKSLKNNESIVVYTDYDVDGVSGGAILWETLFSLGAKVMPYIPHRFEEGYGLSEKGIDFIKKEYNSKLMITVDHGVSSYDKIKYAKKKGIETIILDHHLLPEKLPSSIATVHTTKLSASGLAWIFSNILTQDINSSESKKRRQGKYSFTNRNLDLAALGTIGDLVPLVGSNRVIVNHGLDELNKTERIGLICLIKQAGLRRGNLGTYEVGYIIAPRINASGRIDHAMEALRLICTKDEQRASKLAEKLQMTNKRRQLLMEQAAKHAIRATRDELYINSIRKKCQKLIFVADRSYNQGVIGLVASKLVDEFNLPSIVLSVAGEYSKASARSISGFNIVEAIKKVEGLLTELGGHPMAAGFTVKTKSINKLKQKLINIVNHELDDKKIDKVIKIDMELSFLDITQELYKKINELSPFGVGNPQPVFATRSIKVLNASLVGRARNHLKLKLKQGNSEAFDAIGFGMGNIYMKLTSQNDINVAYTINENTWRGNSTLQIKLKDVNIS